MNEADFSVIADTLQVKFDSKDLRRFEAKQLVKEQNQCWPWIAGKDSSGYGKMIFKNGKIISSHRIAFVIHNQYLPEVVMHICDNPNCVNPFHLIPGTHALNNADKVKKNRQAKGEKHASAKLNPNKVLEMKRLRQDGLTTVILSQMFGISVSQVSHICRGRYWRHVL